MFKIYIFLISYKFLKLLIITKINIILNGISALHYQYKIIRTNQNHCEHFPFEREEQFSREKILLPIQSHFPIYHIEDTHK